MDWRQAGQQSSAGGARNCHDFPESANDSSGKCRTGLRLRGIDEEIGKRTLEVLELLDLVSPICKSKKTCQDLWKHRTALARAMILEPDVILMDEPLRNVSPKFHNQLTQELVEFAGENRRLQYCMLQKCGRWHYWKRKVMSVK